MYSVATVASIRALPVPPSRDPNARARQIPDAVLHRYEGFLDRVRAHRNQQGLTQVELARRLGVSSGNYANFERGYTTISVPKLFALADVLGTNAEALLQRRRSTRQSRKPPRRRSTGKNSQPTR